MTETLTQVLNKGTNEELLELLKLFEKQLTSSVTSEDLTVTDSNRNAKITLIEKELREFGGNSFINLFRGEGPEYDEIVFDVAKKFKISTSGISIPETEERIFCVILQKALDGMSEEERAEFFKTYSIDQKTPLTGQALTAAMMAIFKAGGFKSYQLMLSVVNAVWKFIFGKGLTLAANSALSKVLSVLTGPIGWVITIIWTTLDISGPAYRVTIPAVLYVAMLRHKP